MIFEKKCFKGGNKHNFEPRYDEHEIKRRFEVENISPEDLRNLIYYKTYVYDICTWCGKIIDRSKQ